MPKKNGIETLKEMMQSNPKAVIVMLTSEGQKSSVVEAISLGAKDYIVKKHDRRNVLEKIGSVLNGKK